MAEREKPKATELTKPTMNNDTKRELASLFNISPQTTWVDKMKEREVTKTSRKEREPS